MTAEQIKETVETIILLKCYTLDVHTLEERRAIAERIGVLQAQVAQAKAGGR